MATENENGLNSYQINLFTPEKGNDDKFKELLTQLDQHLKDMSGYKDANGVSYADTQRIKERKSILQKYAVDLIEQDADGNITSTEKYDGLRRSVDGAVSDDLKNEIFPFEGGTSEGDSLEEVEASLAQGAQPITVEEEEGTGTKVEIGDLSENTEEDPEENSKEDPKDESTSESSFLLSIDSSEKTTYGTNSAGNEIDTDDILEIKRTLATAMSKEDEIHGVIRGIDGALSSLNYRTNELLGTNVASIGGDLTNLLSAWSGELDRISSNTEAYYINVKKSDEEGEEDPEGGIPGNTLKNNKDGGGSGGGSSGGSSSSGGGGGISDITPTTPTTPDVYIQSAVAGTLLFSAIVPLFSKIGDPSTIQSSLTTTYEVVGLVFQNGKYYYKLYDPTLKQFYYAEVDKNSKFTTEYKEILKSKEGENTMMLTTPNVGENVFAKMTEPNTPYFIKDKMDQNGINFAMVLDGSDGKYYYVPIDNTVEVVSIDSMISGVPDSSVSESSVGSAS